MALEAYKVKFCFTRNKGNCYRQLQQTGILTGEKESGKLAGRGMQKRQRIDPESGWRLQI